MPTTRQITLAEAIAAWPRLFGRIDIADDGCWVWGGCDNGGYGQVRVGGQQLGTPRRMAYVHRLTYVMCVGEIPDGLTLDHLCRNPACCCPEHLEAVTHRENLARGVGTMATACRTNHCVNGHEFTPENTREYRGERYCRECNKLRKRERRRKQRSAARAGA